MPVVKYRILDFHRENQKLLIDPQLKRLTNKSRRERSQYYSPKVVTLDDSEEMNM